MLFNWTVRTFQYIAPVAEFVQGVIRNHMTASQFLWRIIVGRLLPQDGTSKYRMVSVLWI